MNNVNILKDVSLSRARSAISVIPQDPVLFSGSFRSNLDPFDAYTDDEIWISLEKVQLARKVANFNDQLNSPIIEGGKNLSIGEKQLVCLARALLKHSYLLIIDEATANVDIDTDNRVQQILRTEFKNVTRITIAHRINTIMDSDVIIFMDKGKVVEIGSVEELINENKIFANLVDSDKKTKSQ